MVGSAWEQEHEAAGYIIFAVRKQREECWYSAHFLM